MEAPSIILKVSSLSSHTSLPHSCCQVLHQQVALAASKAGAIHHVGESVARAVNIAEVALDPAHAVDFDCAQVGLAACPVAVLRYAAQQGDVA